MSASILDIETLAQPTEKILANIPPWDEAEARQRVPKNYKKEDAINGWLEDDKANHGKDAIEKAALNPETATIAIVGFWKDGCVHQLMYNPEGMPISLKPEFVSRVGKCRCSVFLTEAELIEHAFMRLGEGSYFSEASKTTMAVSGNNVLGWNLIGFDLKMLIRRAWILGVKVPKAIYNPLSRYPIPERFVDMMDKYRAGSFKDPYTGLSAALKAMGLPEKGDGKEFGKLWQEDRAAALEYSRGELELQAQLYRKMGVDL